MADKFLYLKEEATEGTLYAPDGGVAIIWHNGEHLVGQCYRERIEAKHLRKSLAEAFEIMMEDTSNSAMFDFEDEDEILPLHIQQLADWLVSGREGDFFENLTIFDFDDHSKETVGEELEKVAQEFFDNEHFKEREKEQLVSLIMEHKFGNDDAKYFNSNEKFLETHTLEQLRILSEGME
jgi:hypothetical protein